jgi:hypothetical protein
MEVSQHGEAIKKRFVGLNHMLKHVVFLINNSYICIVRKTMPAVFAEAKFVNSFNPWGKCGRANSLFGFAKS